MTDSLGSSGSLPQGSEAESSDATAQQAGNGDQRSSVRPAFASRSGINIHALSVSRSPSNGVSPRSSRDSSPASRNFRQQSAGATAQGMRSRKDSYDASPHRPPSITGHTVPSAAAIQRALSAATTPQLQTSNTSEPSTRPPRSQRTSIPSGETTPSWPVSPRLKSPPPSGLRRDSLRSQKNTEIPILAPSIVVQRTTSAPKTPETPPSPEPQGNSETRALSPAKVASRGASGASTLETVQESSLPVTPEGVLDATKSTFADRNPFEVLSEAEGQTTPRTIIHNSTDSGSDHDRNKKEEEIDPNSTPRAKSVAPRTSYSSLKPKLSVVEPTTKNMTVETETVSSIPQATLGPPSDRAASGRTEHGGTLRVKASNETIRPGKGRKKASRKAPSINATSGMSFSNVSSSPDKDGNVHGKSHVFHHHSQIFSRFIRPKFQPRSQTTPAPSSSDPFSSTSTLEPIEAPMSSGESFQDDEQAPAWTSHLFRKFSFASTDSRSREASTRADIFEDRVKNAMDEATSDDSDETFVYESNPPEPPVRRSRHHSRTPSGASVSSMADQRIATRSMQGVLSTQKSRSMKFANAYGSGADEETVERQDGTIRASNNRNGGSSIHHHHHLGRPSRNNTGHTSILDDDNSPFPPLNKTRSLTGMPGRQSQNARYVARNLQVSNGTNRKGDGYSSYDMDAEGGDDERTPLMGTVRTPRSVRRSLQTARPRYPEHYPRHQRSILSRCAGFIVLLIMLLLLAFGVVGFLFAISTPLSDVSIIEISNILASEQEIIFDLQVRATNPNLLPITVGDMDIDVFAKSKYVGSERWWREHGNETLPIRVKPGRRKTRIERLLEYSSVKEEVTIRDDPVDDPPSDGVPKGIRQTMLLGRLDQFDTPLSFDGSFWKRHPHYSNGTIRLSKPGNRTELGGTERWERVILHPFELIVRGTLKYKIPLGGRAYAANVGSNTSVRPESGIDLPEKEDGRVHIS